MMFERFSIPPACDSRDDIEVTLFVPCFNEEERIMGTLETIRSALSEIGCSYEVLVVDDGCTDGTIGVVEAFAREHPDMDIRIHRNPCNFGLARSFVDAAFLGRGRYYRLVCGDNVEPGETMRKIVREMGNADMILPYYPTLPGKSHFRRSVSKLWTLLVDTIGGYKIRYYNGCGLYLRYHVMRWAPYNYGFGFQADLITTLLEEGASVKEIPVQGLHFDRPGRKSPLHLRNFLSTGHTLVQIGTKRLRRILYRTSRRAVQPEENAVVKPDLEMRIE
jgi:glycosyltransferase involved in cell wall biosynthesis